MKLFESPVYAFRREVLYNKYENWRARFMDENKERKKESLNKAIEINAYPFCLWDYNHIVGYIRISMNRRDILLDVFLLPSEQKRYLWKSKQKVFLHNIFANGIHFYISDTMSNEDIQVRIVEMLRAVIKTHIPKRYFVDTESFDHLNNKLDYKSLMLEIEFSDPHVHDFKF